MSERMAGVPVVVWRRAPALEVLLLHRPDRDGDWEWTTPGGGREAAEEPRAAAERELLEETGFALTCVPASSARASALVGIVLGVFTAEAPAGAQPALSAEHDGFEWVSPAELSRCRPDWVARVYAEVLAAV